MPRTVFAAVERGKAQCPLCRAIFPNEEDVWKNHLTGRDGCSQNPRRIQSHGGKRNSTQQNQQNFFFLSRHVSTFSAIFNESVLWLNVNRQ